MNTSLPNEDEAIDAIAEELSRRGGVMSQSSLGGPVQWGTNFAHLGKFQDFLKSHSDIFSIEENPGSGKFVHLLTRASPFPDPSDELYRPIGVNDGFGDERTKKIQSYKGYVRKHPDVVALLRGESNPQEILDLAFAKCARLTLAIGQVPDAPDVTNSVIKTLFERFIPACNPCRLFVYLKEGNSFVKDLSITICGPDTWCKRALLSLRTALTTNRVRILKTTCLSLLHIGYRPVIGALADTILDLLDRRQLVLRETQSLASVSPTHQDALRAPSPRKSATQRPTEVAMSPEVVLLPQPDGVWPVEYTYDDLNKRVCDLSDNSSLGVFIVGATNELAEKEANLRARCVVLRDLPVNPLNHYAHAQYCEWIAEPEFLLGRGTEASLYMGLYEDPTNPGCESVLVAIKQSHSSISPFNSQERDHLFNLKRHPGIAQYHTSFQLDCGLVTLFILALDIGLISLRDLISVKKVQLSAEQKFKLTKALCMAVSDLHTECSVVHRDLRPENVLLMRDGKVCITDFGLSRTAEIEGKVKFTMQPKTIMQPFEVQEMYQDAKAAPIPITRHGDVFMLGCVLAYIHQGRDPFLDNAQILAKNEPDLDKALEAEQPWLFHLIRSMLQHYPNQRPTIAYVLKHPYFVGHTTNFDACLIRGIEFTVVMDYKPKDDHTFRALEAVLLPIEQQMAAEKVKWHDKLPQSLFDDFRLPFSDPNLRLKFVVDGEETSREHPLPLLAQLLRWHRNVINHFSEQMQSNLRRTKGVLAGNNSYYATGGEFFMTHPSVAWLLPAIWTVTSESIAQIEQERVALIVENERRIEQFERDLRTLADKRVVTARVLEWNK